MGSKEHGARSNSVVLCVCSVFSAVKAWIFGFFTILESNSIIVKFKFRQPEISMGRTITNPFLYIWGSVKIKA